MQLVFCLKAKTIQKSVNNLIYRKKSNFSITVASAQIKPQDNSLEYQVTIFPSRGKQLHI